MNTTTAKPATADQADIVSEIWDTLSLLKRPCGPDDIRHLVTDESGEFKSPAALRAIRLQLKEEFRKG